MVKLRISHFSFCTCITLESKTTLLRHPLQFFQFPIPDPQLLILSHHRGEIKLCWGKSTRPQHRSWGCSSEHISPQKQSNLSSLSPIRGICICGWWYYRKCRGECRCTSTKSHLREQAAYRHSTLPYSLTLLHASYNLIPWNGLLKSH